MSHNYEKLKILLEMPKLEGKGHEILSLLNIDYHEILEEITDELMGNPEKRFRLSVKQIPEKKPRKK